MARILVDPTWPFDFMLKYMNSNEGYVVVFSGDSNIKKPDIQTFKTFYLPDSLEELQSFITQHSILSVMACCESGLLCAENIAIQTKAKFIRSVNCVAPISELRNKFMMHEKLREKNIRHIKQRAIHGANDIEGWEIFPCILKPTESIGQNGVQLVTSFGELVTSYNAAKQSTSPFGQKNSFVLQEFLVGIEYIVDTVSNNGVHKLLYLWQYEKEDDHITRTATVLLKKIDQALVEYAFSVLSAFEIQNGVCHLEIMKNGSDCCLVELNARCIGIPMDISPAMTKLGLPDLYTLAFDVYKDGKIFSTINTYQPKANFSVKILHFPKGVIASSICEFEHYLSSSGLTTLYGFGIPYYIREGLQIPGEKGLSFYVVVGLLGEEERIEEDIYKLHQWWRGITSLLLRSEEL